VELDTSLGNVTLALEQERAPITVGNFLNLTRVGFYDGLAFHRVVAGFVVQGGDPTSRGDDGHATGAGGPGYTIPDEFNPTLRHDAAGIASMANAGPGTGGSQFFLTLAAARNLDDRHSVFGRVESGLDVVQAIGRVAVDASDAPLTPVRIDRAVVLPTEATDATHAVGVHAVVAQKNATPGRPVTFAVVLENAGDVRDEVTLDATVPEGWSCATDGRQLVPAGTARVAFLTLTPTGGAVGETSIPLRALSAWSGASEADTSVDVAIAAPGVAVRDGDTVVADYAGFLPDGRLFDTSIAAVAHDPAMPKLDTPGGWVPRASYDPLSFTVGDACQAHAPPDCVVPGFSTLARSARVGETVTMRIPAEDAYPTGDVYQAPLTGRDLVFELKVLRIGSP
jgi:cyclophilin family peptidyl-prolyl cis-trans isomerase/FKBP-type peptidyl-prolyl cis-trans isomerase 2